MIDELLDPQLDWRELLAMEIRSTIRDDFTWMKPSRKGMNEGFYLPGSDVMDTVDLAVAIDTSGSIGQDMLLDFLSEIAGIMEQYVDFTLRIWCFDTQVHNPQEFTPDNMDELLDYELAGFGGTMFEPNWEFMKDNDIEPKKFVMFTDGYPCGGWGDEDYCDTLFIIHGDHKRTPTAPFGLSVKYTRDDVSYEAA